MTFTNTISAGKNWRIYFLRGEARPLKEQVNEQVTDQVYDQITQIKYKIHQEINK